MTSEQPGKYVYCENENNPTVIFPPILTLFGDNFSCDITIANRRLHHLESRIKKKKKKKKMRKIAQKSKILVCIFLFDCLNGPELLHTIDRKYLRQYTSFEANKMIT